LLLLLLWTFVDVVVVDAFDAFVVSAVSVVVVDALLQAHGV
jgi:hypothetical protein